VRALITGASQGIGLGIAERFAEPGVKLALCGSAPSSRLDSAIENAQAKGADTLMIVGDLSDPDVPAELVARALERFGGLDCVVANAAERRPASLVTTTVSDWDRDFAVNVRGTWRLAVAAYDALRESAGSVVAVGSVAGASPQPGLGAYSVCKAALEMLVRQLAVEWAPDGIRVNMVHPGFTMTPKNEAVHKDRKLLQARLDMVPMGRLGCVEDVAAAVAFLAGPEAPYCTGQRLVVDGGLLDSLFARDPSWTPSSRPPE
jgi:glucose 1-dehydrogenase